MKTAIVWAKRATGVGYKDFPPLSKEPLIHPERGDLLKQKSSQVVKEVERLERELSRLGIRSPKLWR
jgi:hypothetical protein